MAASQMPRPADSRAIAAASARNVDLSGHRTRRVASGDFGSFDWLLALDDSVHAALMAAAPAGHAGKVRKLMSFAPHMGATEVPDPWYGGQADYEHALDLITAGVDGLLASLPQRQP